MENNFAILQSTWVSKSSLYCDFSLRPPITGKVNAVVFSRFKESFDIVDHEILLSKLNAYTVSGFGVCEQLG